MFSIFLSMFAVQSHAHDIQVKNADGVTIYYVWTNNKTELAVSYRGNYSGSESYKGDVVIPESVIYEGNAYPVTSIGEEAFYCCVELTSVTIPNGVTSIGKQAFVSCDNLNSVIIPNSVASIGDYAFDGCLHLVSIIIPNGVTRIGKRTFAYCPRLTSITIPNSVTSIGYEAFYRSSGFMSIVIPNSVTSIEDKAFCECCSLISVIIPNSVTSIGEWAFNGCTGLNSVTIGNGVTYIDNGTFGNCTSLTSVTFGDNVTSFGGQVFADCKSLTSIVIPNGMTDISNYVFSGCTGLISVTIPNSVTSIDGGAFYGCSSLTCISIPNSVTKIGYRSFYGCSGLTSVVIPNSVISIGEKAFYGCSGLASITIPKNVASIGEGAFGGCDLSTLTVDEGNSFYDSRDNCNAIIRTATNTLVAGCMNMTIPNSITSIGGCAFSGCTGQTTINIPNSVTQIGKGAFSDCKSITSMVIPNSVTSISEEVFKGCTGLISIILPNNVSYIGAHAFDGCSNLIDIIIPNGVTYIGESAFSDCTALTSITIPNRATMINSAIFSGCNELKEVIWLLESIQPTISLNIFSGCPIKSATLKVPENSINLYKHYEPWSGFGIIVGNSVDKEAANEVVAKIDVIGEVVYTDVSKALIDAARSAYNNITNAQKALVTNSETLITAEATYADLKITADNKFAADIVIANINAIGKVVYTDASKTLIDVARLTYNALTEAQKLLVTNAGILTSAEAMYEVLRVDNEAANSVIVKINAIGEVTYSDASKALIDAASEAYNALTDVQKTLVANLETLTTAETTYIDLKTAVENHTVANAVIVNINAIGKVVYTDASKALIDVARESYNALTDAQKALVTNLETLITAEATYADLKTSADNQTVADIVIANINAIGEVTYTDASKTLIDAARESYNNLTDAQKTLVTNIETLNNAETTYTVLKKAADAQIVADAVVANINAIGEVTYTDASKNLIDAARMAYDALSYAQKALVTNVEVLIAAETKYEELQQMTTSINVISADEAENTWYDLSGRKLSQKPVAKGVYILNGKTVFIK